MESHVDLIRNDWKQDRQDSVARIYLRDDGCGLIVKDAVAESWEGNIFDVVGDIVRQPASRIVETLQHAFHGPYLVVSDRHADGDCPFRHGPVALERHEVKDFELPRPIKPSC